MASGQQLAEKNVRTFTSWVASKTVEDFRAMVSRGVLSREEIAEECGFAKSALNQNPRIKATLRRLEDDLRQQGVLPPLASKSADPEEPPQRSPSQTRTGLDAERLRRLEQENASLKAEVSELRRQLSQYAVLQDALAMTGRLPR